MGGRRSSSGRRLCAEAGRSQSFRGTVCRSPPLEIARRARSHHYDVGNASSDRPRPAMTYSCAYVASPDQSLDDAHRDSTSSSAEARLQQAIDFSTRLRLWIAPIHAAKTRALRRRRELSQRRRTSLPNARRAVSPTRRDRCRTRATCPTARRRHSSVGISAVGGGAGPITSPFLPFYFRRVALTTVLVPGQARRASHGRASSTLVFPAAS